MNDDFGILFLNKHRIVSSPPFAFLVGPDLREFTIHSALVAHQSRPLDALINGNMKEAIERCVKWEDIDEKTFIRFSQYVYTGAYNEEVPTKREMNVPKPEDDLDVFQHDVGSSLGSKKKVKKTVELLGSKKECLWQTFKDFYQPALLKHEPLPNAPDDDYTETLLCHARMYAFADRYGIDALQTLALRKLKNVLLYFELHSDGWRDIMTLIHYSFDETVDKGDQADALRSLICFYTACKLEDLWGNAEFRNLTRDLPDFPVGLISVILTRLD